MRMLSFVIIIAFCLIFVPSRFADEGMWTFDNPPLKQWKEKYGFEPSREWLDHMRLSTVRLSEGAGGGTGSFIVMFSYKDVTKRVQGAAKPEAPDKGAAARRQAEMAA